MMQQRTRFRRGSKWGGSVLTVLLVVIMVGSAGRREPGVAITRSLDIFVTAGRLRIEYYARPRGSNELPYTPCLKALGHSRRQGFEWWFQWGQWSDVRLYSTEVFIPLWVLVLLTGLPTGWLWWRERERPGLCASCGYDLRGNASGVCPECGAECKA